MKFLYNIYIQLSNRSYLETAKMPLSSCLPWDQGKRKIQSRKRSKIFDKLRMQPRHLWWTWTSQCPNIRSGKAKAERRMHWLELAKEAEASPSRGKDPVCDCRLTRRKAAPGLRNICQVLKCEGKGRREEAGGDGGCQGCAGALEKWTQCSSWRMPVAWGLTIWKPGSSSRSSGQMNYLHQKQYTTTPDG